MGFFTGKKVLVTGGTGTIGQSLVNQILADNPAVVRVFSRDEYKQFIMQQKLQAYDNIRYLIGDIRDYDRLERAMEGIDYVFHTAAMKQVPACEYDPFEAVKTNVIGTQNVILASMATGVKKTVYTSTDKAIAPTNTYGASKLMGERLFSSAQYQAGSSQTQFAAVRFGNVMGSRGSVIPLFKQQIIESREITLTRRDMSRFMMTVEQATKLTVKAMQYSQGGEIFVLKMPVVRLNDLAKVIVEVMARKLGISKGAIAVKEIGLRPGEKMYEELMTEEESAHAWELPDMFIIPNQFLREKKYDGAVPVGRKKYGSHQVEPLTMEEVRTMILPYLDDPFIGGDA